MPSQYIFDPKIYHRGRPNSRHRVGEEEFCYNSLGFRDIERVREKPNDVFRIAVIGDSFVEGYECAYESTIGPSLQRRVDQDSAFKGMLRKRGIRSIEVIPFGLGGFCPSFYLALLEAYCLGFSPDLVYVNVFSFNDIAGLIPFKERVRGGGYRTPFADYFVMRDGELVLERSMLAEYRRYLRNQALQSTTPFRLIRRVANLLGGSGAPVPVDPWVDQYSSVLAKGMFTYFAEEPETQRAYELCSHFLKKMGEAADRSGARLCVVHLANADCLDAEVAEREKRYWRRFSNSQQIREYNDASIDLGLPSRKLKDACHQWGLDFLDLNDYVAALSPQPDWTELFSFRHPTDPEAWIKWGHYLPCGNSLWAEMLHAHATSRAADQLARRPPIRNAADDYNPYLYPLY